MSDFVNKSPVLGEDFLFMLPYDKQVRVQFVHSHFAIDFLYRRSSPHRRGAVIIRRLIRREAG